MLRLALREPVAAGVKVTLIVQLAAAATLVPQVFVCTKSLLCAPVTVMLVIVKLAFPVLVRVTVCAVLVVPTDSAAKGRLPGVRLTPGAEVTPVPVTFTICGLLN